MPKYNVKFIAADMDGTLLNENAQLDPDFFTLYQQLENKNIMFAAASGRQYYSLVETFSPLSDRMIFIAENGSFVMHQGRELYSCTINTPSIHNIIKQARLMPDTYFVLCGKKSAYIETQDPQALAEFSKYYHRCQYVDDLLSVDDEFIKVALCHFNGAEEHIYPTINDQFGNDHQVVVSAKIWLDIMNKAASKGAAIKHLQNTLGFSFEQTMSFGDYLNDIEMLQQSYYSFAMENAHQMVKESARFMAPSNKEAGVYRIIRDYVL